MKKKLLLLFIALITISLLVFSACNDPANDDGGDGGTENGGTETSGENNGKFKKYSKLIQNVLANAEYNKIISDHRYGIITDEKLSSYMHPFGFLEDEGYDINAIKSGNVKCYSRPFFYNDQPNTLYFVIGVENSDCFTNYMIKYDLTEKERKEYLELCNLSINYDGGHCTYQTFFINDQISKDKKATIVSESYINKSLYNSLHESISGYDLAHDAINTISFSDYTFEDGEPHTQYEIIMISFDTSYGESWDNTVNFIVVSTVPYSMGIHFRNLTLSEITCKSRSDYFSSENNILTWSQPLDRLRIEEKEKKSIKVLTIVPDNLEKTIYDLADMDLSTIKGVLSQ